MAAKIIKFSIVLINECCDG